MNFINAKDLILGLVLLIIGVALIIFQLTSNSKDYSNCYSSESAILIIPLTGVLLIWNFIKKK